MRVMPVLVIATPVGRTTPSDQLAEISVRRGARMQATDPTIGSRRGTSTRFGDDA